MFLFPSSHVESCLLKLLISGWWVSDGGRGLTVALQRVRGILNLDDVLVL